MISDPRRRRPTAKGAASRAAILGAAAPIFAEHGYRGASLASVAQSAGLTQPGLLHHFPSKEHLLLALLEESYHADGRILEDHASLEGSRLLDALLQIVRNNELSSESVRLFAVVSAESISSDHPAHSYFVQRYRKVRQRMLRELRAGQDAGELSRDIDLDLFVPIIVGVMDGIQNQWLLDSDVDLVGSFELFCRLMGQILQGSTQGSSPDAHPVEAAG